jgi:hypothetical protein
MSEHEWDQEAVAAYLGGDSAAAIADRLGVDVAVVSGVLRRNGVEERGLDGHPGVSTRTRNGLYRQGYTRPRDLLQVSEAELRGFRGLGAKSVGEALAVRRTAEKEADDGLHACEMCGDWDLVMVARSVTTLYKACGHVDAEAHWVTFTSSARDTVELVREARAALAERFGSEPEQWGVIYVKATV